MRMTLYGCLLTIALVGHPAVSGGNEHSHRKAAENLLIVMEVDKSLPKIAEQVVESQLKQNPQLASQRDIFQKFFTKYLNWESVKEETITAYTQEFTEPELKKLTEFYTDPCGEESQRENAEARVRIRTDWPPESAGQSSGTPADDRRKGRQTGRRGLVFLRTGPHVTPTVVSAYERPRLQSLSPMGYLGNNGESVVGQHTGEAWTRGRKHPCSVLLAACRRENAMANSQASRLVYRRRCT